MAAGKANPFKAAANRKAPTPTRAPAKRVRVDPIRVTLDLQPTAHGNLKRWCNRTAAERDLPAVPLAVVLRLLGDELLSDVDLSARIADRLAELHES